MKVSQKLRIGFAVVILIAMFMSIAGIVGMNNIYRSGRDMYEKQVAALELLGVATEKFKQLQIEIKRVIICGFYDDMREAIDSKNDFEKGVEEFRLIMLEVRGLEDDEIPENLLQFYELIDAKFENEYLPIARETIDMSIGDMPDHFNKLYINVKLNSLNYTTDVVNDLMLGLMRFKSIQVDIASQENAEITQDVVVLQVFLIIMTIIAAVIITRIIIRDIAEPLNEASAVLQNISGGNFDVRIKGYYKGEFNNMKETINDAAKKLLVLFDEKAKAEQSEFTSKLTAEKAVAAKEAVLDSIIYASKIQKNLIANDAVFKRVFTDYSVTWKPRDVVGGDIYWLKEFEEGAVLCVCDCTGHGTPGALLTMLVVSAFESQVNNKNYKDTAEIIWLLERKLVGVLNVDSGVQEAGASDIKDGCDLAVLYISKSGEVSISSANTHVFISNGKDITQIKGQKLYVGEGKIKSKEDIKVTQIEPNSDNKFYIASDGLYDQMGGTPPRPFGYRRFKEIILNFHGDSQQNICTKIWKAFEEYQGTQMRRDDVELISFKI
ncbi:MAG: MCP four helix bundle domain-containing protein [Oscillospiraceae bacterium]|nr:MCP four helix bundle domain-containing protein [Oscillospiraceae bacterium]